MILNPATAGLQDGMFSNKNPNLGKYVLEGLGMENDGIGILWPFGIYSGHLVYLIAVW
jgi:hypothetical protein